VNMLKVLKEKKKCQTLTGQMVDRSHVGVEEGWAQSSKNTPTI